MNTATQRQIDLVNTLKAERELDDFAEVALIEARTAWTKSRFDSRHASRLIETLMALPFREVEQPSAGLYLIEAGLGITEPVTVRVYFGKASGKMLVKSVHATPDGYEYEYEGAAERVLGYRRTFRRLTLEEAGELGRATGACAVCGRRLDDPESVDRGIGPICAEKF